MSTVLACKADTFGDSATGTEAATSSTTETSMTATTATSVDPTASSSSGLGTGPEPSTGTTGDSTSSRPGVCGNGEVEGDEECDDGNIDNKDDCINSCHFARCGDGYANAAKESCDDANTDSTDNCVNCMLATCGDGAVWSGLETCDDGNKKNDDACSNSCELPRFVFVTSEKYAGDLTPMIPGKSGIALADAHCQELAANARLPGIFRAWISTSTDAAADRFDTSFKGSYQLVDHTVVAGNGWPSFRSENHINPINLDEAGDLAYNLGVWTGTHVDGEGDMQDCKAWTSVAPEDLALVGVSSVGMNPPVPPAKWTEGTYDCGNFLHLYCVEDQ